MAGRVFWARTSMAVAALGIDASPVAADLGLLDR